MSVYTDIRGALQVRAATASGFPAVAQRKYEGRRFTPTTGTTWVRMTLFPSSGRPAVVGGALHLHEGLFQVDLFYPASGDPGTSAVETLGDAVKAVFQPGGSPMTQGSEAVTVRFAERSQVMEEEPDWLRVMVTVGWRCFSSNI